MPFDIERVMHRQWVALLFFLLLPCCANAAQFVGAASSCTAPVVSATASVNPVNANQDLILTANISGGQAPYAVSWDLDGDGSFERTGAGLIQLLARYPSSGANTVRLRVNDALGCSAELSQVVTVRAAQVVLTAGTPIQLCGNGNAIIEPGERFRLPVSVSGNDVATLDAQLIFTGAGGANRGPLRLESPAVALAAVGAGNPTRSVNVDFQVRPEASCGATSIDFAGMVDSNTFQAGAAGFAPFAVGASGACNVVHNCPYALSEIQPRAAAYFNPARAGNGIDLHFFPTPTGTQANFGWYTARADRSPIWYGGEGIWLDRQANITLTENRWNGSSAPATVVGSGTLTALASERMVMTYTLRGKPGGEPLSFTSFGTPGNAPNYTGLWFDPTQPGWGFTVNSQLQTQLIAAYSFDTLGLPFWTVGVIEAGSTSALALEAVDAHCPACVWLPPTGRAAGTLSRNFTGLNTMLINLNVTDPRAPWLRSNRQICKIGTQCAGTSAAPAPTAQELQCQSAGWAREVVAAGGLQRLVLWKAPLVWTRGAVVILHGGGGSHTNFCVANVDLIAPQVRFTELALAQGFAVFLLDSWDQVSDNEGRICGKVWDDEVRTRANLDLPFFEDVLRRVIPAKRPVGSRSEIFVAGHSSGGYMAVRAASRFPDLVTAFAPLASGDPYGWFRNCTRRPGDRINVAGAGFDNETRRQITEPGACEADSYPNEQPWDGAASALKPAFRQFYHAQDGINDRSCVAKVRTQLLLRGYPEVAPFMLDGGARSADVHNWLDQYNAPVLNFFTSRLPP